MVKTMDHKIRQLDEKWQVVVNHKADYKCEICHDASGDEPFRLIPAWNSKVRYDLQNGISVCPSCLCSINSDLQGVGTWLKRINPDAYTWLVSMTAYYDDLPQTKQEANIEQLEEYCRTNSI